MAVCLEISSVEVLTVCRRLTLPGNLSIWLQPRPVEGARLREEVDVVKTGSWSGTRPTEKLAARFAHKRRTRIVTERYLCMEKKARRQRMESS